MAANIDPLEQLFGGARRDCLVARRPDGILNVFDPVAATHVEAVNTEALHVADSLIDLLKPREARARVRWTEVRAALIEQNRRLTTPLQVKALHERMRAFLLAHLNEEQNLTWLIGRAVAFALIPQIVDGLSEADLKRVETDQEARVGKFLNPQPISTGRRMANFIRLQRATSVISKEIRRRLAGQSPPREDFLQSLLPFTEQLGVSRLTYLVMTLISASSVAPEATAACLVYAMHRYPEWRAQIEEEMAGLKAGQLYTLPVRELPSTLRFIKETMRIWPFPFGVQREAVCDVEFDGVNLRKGERYAVSSYIAHHEENCWHDPEQFDPDRWLSPRRTVARGTYVPFGFAPRSCVGAAVAHAQLLLICDLFSRCFRIEMSEGSEPRMTLNFIALPIDMIGRLRTKDPN